MSQKARLLSAVDVRCIMILLENPRDQSMFAFGLYTGLAMSEVITLTQDAVFLEGDCVRESFTITRSRGKAPRVCEIPIHPKLKELLREHRKTLPAGRWLFPSRWDFHVHISRQQAHKILATTFNALKREDARAHSMRRTFLTKLLAANLPAGVVQEISGLSRVDNLGRYQETKRLPSDKKRAIMQLPY